MSSKRTSPRDATGRKAVELAELHAPELAERAGQISTISVAPVVEDDDYTDYDAGPQVTVGEISVDVPMRKLRVNDDIEQMTYGHGRTYDFKRGVTYTVPADLYRHLDEIGLVYH